MGDIGIKSSKSGEDVFKAENKNLVYSSSFNSLKVAESGNVTVSGDPEDISHSLGYEAAYLAYIQANGATGYRVAEIDLLAASNSVEMDSAKIRFNSVTSGDKIAYFIFYDPIDTGFTEYNRAKTANHGMKVSQGGEDVAKVTDTKTSFNSEYNTLQIRDVYSIAGPTDAGTETITHSYGYTPAFLGTFKRNVGGTDYYFTMPFNEPTGGVTLYATSKVNTIEVYGAGADFSGDTVNIITFTESLE